MTAKVHSECERMRVLLEQSLASHPLAREMPPIAMQAGETRLDIECGVVAIALETPQWFRPATREHAEWLAGWIAEALLREWRWYEA